MVTRARTKEYMRHLNKVSDLANDEFQAAYEENAALDGETLSTLLLYVLTILTRQYGDIAGTLAAEFYEEARAAEIGGTFVAQIANPWGAEHFDKALNYASRRFFGRDQDPQASIDYLKNKLGRAVKNSAHSTITTNATADTASGVKYARIPTGAETCDYCLKIASYGFCFPSEERAGALKKFHTNCDCAIVPSWYGEGPLLGAMGKSTGGFSMPTGY